MKLDLKDKVIIFSDLDGTALHSEHTFTQETIDMVQKVYDSGLYFCPITARSTSDGFRQAKILGVDKRGGIASFNNGSQIYDFKNDKWIFNGHIDPKVVKAVFDKTFGYVGKYKVHYFADDATYVYGEGENSRYWSDVMKVEYKVITEYNEIAKPITHMTVILPKEVTDKQIETFYEDFTHISPEVDIIKYTNRVYEVCVKGVNKGFAVRKICEYLGYTRKTATSFGFGDSHNDFDMFAQVDYGVAMGNALPDLQIDAEFITLTNDENGVADFVENKILKQVKGEK